MNTISLKLTRITIANIIILAMLCISLQSSLPLSAQTERITPTSDARLNPPPFDVFPTTRVIFPQAIQFELAVGLLAENVSRIVLEIDLPDGEQLIVQFTEASQLPLPSNTATDNRVILPYDFAREFVVVRYEWQVTDAPPFLFGEVAFRWRIATQGALYDVTDRVIYEDSRLTWDLAQNSDEMIRIALGGNNADSAEQLLQRLQRVYDFMASKSGQTPRLNILVYPPDITIGCAQDENGHPIVTTFEDNQPEDIPCDQDLADRVNRDFIITQIRQPNAFVNGVITDLVNAFYAPLWRNADVPRWFSHGLTQLFATRPPSGALTVSQTTLRTGRALSLIALNDAPDEAQRTVWDAQSYGMVLYIANTYGLETLFTLAQTLNAYPSFGDAYFAFTDETIEALIPAWEVWLYTASAERAYGYSVYADTTPTPTITPSMTATALPPTPTETVTATAILTNTPRPTRTPIPPTATITPLPAQGFIVRATPMPTPMPESNIATELGGNTGQAVIIGVIVVLVSILAIIGMIWGRRE